MRSLNSRRSGPSALGLRSTPLLLSQTPARRLSGPRLAKVSGSGSGSVKMSSGKGSMDSERSRRRAARHLGLELGQRPRQARDVLERLFHGMRGAQCLAVATEAADDLKAKRHLLVVEAAG